MAQVSKRKLSASTNGRQIKISATTSGGAQAIHVATASVNVGTFDEVWLYATNTDAADRILNVCLGGTTNPDDLIFVTIPAGSVGRYLVLDGVILQGGATLSAYATSFPNVINVSGFVNAITA